MRNYKEISDEPKLAPRQIIAYSQGLFYGGGDHRCSPVCHLSQVSDI